MLQQLLRPATAAAAIDGRNRKILVNFFAFIEKATAALLYCGAAVAVRGAAIRALLYGP